MASPWGGKGLPPLDVKPEIAGKKHVFMLRMPRRQWSSGKTGHSRKAVFISSFAMRECLPQRMTESMASYTVE